MNILVLFILVIAFSWLLLSTSKQKNEQDSSDQHKTLCSKCGTSVSITEKYCPKCKNHLNLS